MMRRCVWNILVGIACLLPTVILADEPKAPATVKELYVDFDPRKAPLDAKVVREWEKDSIIYRYINYHIGMFKGEPARMCVPSFIRDSHWSPPPFSTGLNRNIGITQKLDGVTLKNGSDFRFGFEQTKSGKDLVIWIKQTIDLTAIEDHLVAVSILPAAR